ncbi:MAG: hypothetical protein LBT31_01230 [Synergistaceae bacterium]|jgi:hypothetical protein|nr:hypothetical protein [Synergistaceae bacterium]
MKNKKSAAFFEAVLIVSSLAAVALFASMNLEDLKAWAVTLPANIISPRKEEVVMRDNDKIMLPRRANVLFMLDTGSPMTFSPLGTMPVQGANVLPGYTAANQATAAAMLAQATYGHGGRPATTGADRYGRDLDATNNWKTGDTLAQHINDYYSPYEEANNPMGAAAAPYGLIFRNEANKSAQPGGTITTDMLVPNDSRMYKMKLVMWRVLSDTVLIENLRIGMATTFQELNGPGTSWTADFYKVAPWGVGVNYGGTLPNPPFSHGTAPSWSTGCGTGSAGYGSGSAAYWGIDRDYYDSAVYPKTSMIWRLVNRAYLRVPIREYSEEHINQFRLWLDGFEDNTLNVAGAPYFFKNPELFGDGITFLSTAIYPGHPQLNRSTMLGQTDVLGRPGVVFSSRTAVTTSSIAGAYGAALNTNPANGVGNYFRQNSGEALGTVLDFFSPPVDGVGGVTTSAYNVNVAPQVSFPLMDECDKNWVVIFTAGDDSSEYSAAKAAEDLYNYTKNNNLTALDNVVSGQNQFKSIRLKDGVRTLVVGFVDPVDPGVQPLRDKLDAIARSGDIGNTGAHAYFANDVEGLMQALRAVLARINNEIQPSPGPLTEGSKMDDQASNTDPNAFNLFSTGYRINMFDQWVGTMSRFTSTKDSYGNTATTEKWELNDTLIKARGTNSVTPPRKVYYWHNNALTSLGYTASMTDSTEHPIASMIGVTNAFVASMDKSNLRPPTMPATQDPMTDRLHPSRALVNWFYGWDFSYYDNVNTSRRSMLSDFGQSGTALVSPPDRDFLPFNGYAAWADSMRSIDTRLYAQTNDGVLHVVNPQSSGANLEQYSILPPSSLLPLRLPSLKMGRITQGAGYAMRWIDVSEFASNTSDDIPISSIPAYVLDGPVQSRAFNIASKPGWGLYLIGTLGRAGNGIYTMDVTSPSAPKFYWYRETIENADGTLTLLRMKASENEPAVSTVTPNWTGVGGIYANPDAHPFYQLGYNSPKPEAGVMMQLGATEPRNIIVLPGGLQRSLDLANNGRMGAALYIIDPDAAKHTAFDNSAQWVKVFNSASLTESSWRVGSADFGPAPYMGMMVSKPVLRKAVAPDANHGNHVAGQVFASDNRGNIFVLMMENPDGSRLLSDANWKLRTAATLRLDNDPPTASYSSPFGVVIASVHGDSNLYAAGGTANVGTLGNDDNDSALVRNKSQMIYSFKLPDLADASAGTSRRGSWTQLGRSDDSKMPSSAPGWFIPLQGATAGHGEEYASAQPDILGNEVFFATYIPEIISTGGSGACADEKPLGKSRLYVLDLLTGGGIRWKNGAKYIEFGGSMITGITLSLQGGTETIGITFDISDPNALAASVSAHKTNGDLEASFDPTDPSAGSTGWIFKSLRGHTKPEMGASVTNYWIMK